MTACVRERELQRKVDSQTQADTERQGCGFGEGLKVASHRIQRWSGETKAYIIIRFSLS